MRKMISLLLAACMIFGLTACGPSEGEKPSDSVAPSTGENSGAPATSQGVINFDEDPYEVSIQFVGLFETNNNIENVEAVLNEITRDKINCTVDIVPVFVGDLASNTTMGVAGDEKMDVVVAGLTSSMVSLVSDEVLLPLDDLLAERGQAALEATANVAEAQKIDGVTYAITGYPYAALGAGFVYNKDMAEEYGIDMHDGMTMDDLTEVGRILKEHGVYLTTHGNGLQNFYKNFLGGDFFGSTAEYGGILDPVNSTTIVNVYDTQEMRDFFKILKNWTDSGYMPADQLTDTTTTQQYFFQKHVFGSGVTYDPSQIASWVNSDFEVGIVRLTDPVITTSSVNEFMLGIATNCERPDKAMDLINLIYSDPDVVNLLQYGVEGTDYVAVEGTENVITRDGTPNADMSSYYSGFVRYGSQMDRKIMAPLTDSYYDDLQAFEDSAGKSQSFGYIFTADGFGAETGAISSVLSQRLPMLGAGLVENVDTAVDELVAALEDAGINDVIAANQAALDTYLGK